MVASALKKEGRELIPKCWVARDPFSRFLGLMGKKSIPANEAVAFPRCNSIHTFFMRFPIDVLLVGDGGEVVDVVEAMRTWRLMLPRRKVRHVVELAAGRCRELGIAQGARLTCEGAWE